VSNSRLDADVRPSCASSVPRSGRSFLRASAITFCASSVEPPPVRRFGFRFAKDLRGVRRNGVPDSPISVALPSSLPAVTRGSIPRRVGCHKSVDYDTPGESIGAVVAKDVIVDVRAFCPDGQPRSGTRVFEEVVAERDHRILVRIAQETTVAIWPWGTFPTCLARWNRVPLIVSAILSIAGSPGRHSR